MGDFCKENELCETMYMYFDNCYTRGKIKTKYLVCMKTHFACHINCSSKILNVKRLQIIV